MSNEPVHKLAVLATVEFQSLWNLRKEVTGANAFYESLSDDQKRHLKGLLRFINESPDAPEPAKMPLETAVEILQAHNYWRRSATEDELPAPPPHSAELVGKAIDRVVEFVPEYMRLAQMVIDLDALSIPVFAQKYKIESEGNLETTANTAKILLSK